MDNRLILTICIGKQYKKIAALTHPLIIAYAERVGADFHVIRYTTCSFAHWAKFQMYDLLDEYDRIMYTDTDVIIRPDCPDVFNLVPETQLGAFNEEPFVDHAVRSMKKTCLQYAQAMPKWDGKYYNGGILVVSRQHKQLFKPPAFEGFSFYEQGYLNMQIANLGIDMYDLGYRFNRMNCMKRYKNAGKSTAYIIHYASHPDDIDKCREMIGRDLGKYMSPRRGEQHA